MDETAVGTESPVVAAASVGLVEALLFASGKPVSTASLAEASELPPAEIEAALAEIGRRCDAEGRGIRLERVGGGWRLVARNEHDVPIRRLLGMDGRTKLSMAALETLAIVAYRQPITAPEVAELRGVTSASSVRTLLDKRLITTAGRKPVVGTPFLYRTTKEFLVHFGLADLSELPKPEELEALYGIEAGAPDPAQTELFPEAAPTGQTERSEEDDS
jgi:segregation and condensation protein B